MDRPQLWAVTDNVNQEKGAEAPDTWRPPLESFHCDYARSWVEVKHYWGLSVTEAEAEALGEMMGLCSVDGDDEGDEEVDEVDEEVDEVDEEAVDEDEDEAVDEDEDEEEEDGVSGAVRVGVQGGWVVVLAVGVWAMM